MKRAGVPLAAVMLLLMWSLPALGEETEERSSTLEDRIFEMNEWMYAARKAAGEGDYEQEAFYLNRMAEYDLELFPNEITWALAPLGGWAQRRGNVLLDPQRGGKHPERQGLV